MKIHDLRRPPPNLPVASGKAKEVDPFVILTVGTDCNVGKMTAQLQITKQLNDRGIRTRFVATGQTGIMIEGWGIAVDAVVADFIAGAAEWLVLEGSKDADIVLVEGQGSPQPSGLFGVTCGLLHGSCPDALILCHQATRIYIGDYRPAAWLKMPSLKRIRAALRVGGGLRASDQDRRHRAQHLRSLRSGRPRRLRRRNPRDGTPCTDPVRFDPSVLVDAVALRARSVSEDEGPAAGGGSPAIAPMPYAISPRAYGLAYGHLPLSTPLPPCIPSPSHPSPRPIPAPSR